MIKDVATIALVILYMSNSWKAASRSPVLNDAGIVNLVTAADLIVVACLVALIYVN